ncbi:unnamed protein product [Rotaria magnacalcarata]|uniref:protein-serine/threonine phosphatase n=1 Tax=Rotaria magnacalcarata TaxID=392030 RepID=A0A816GQA8_9BILA|nr:unnamed protein product [Rotaria magnacalcarata]CAF1676568.1 unnamed protein product [Rotaria magnacalcarata]CAF2140447.1 unnamed protein product [Rotaria magnacalcarata]CAF4092617.1 unnamed protein product [Rotaria magnacalcarata]CAF4121708.1 unnamed protein product [Rotaria magnacalcarata]
MSHSVNSDVKELKFNFNKSVQVCKIMVGTDMRLMENDSIFTMVDTNGQRQSFLSPVSGTVTKLCVHESDILSYDSIILEYEECRHAITFKNLCGDCGIDLSQVKNALSASTSVKALASIEPSFLDVNLLCRRKLHLLINLDQTLADTTNSRNYYPSSLDIVAYQPTPISKTFYTKLRPGVKEFLTNLRPFYQFHIITFGDQVYTHNIVKLIDPNKRFFSDRIISRDECFKLTDETVNLNNLFPCGDSLVCIIDGHDDIWKSTRNLVYVKPYMWFKDIGDINEIHPSSATGISEKTHQYNDETSKRPKEHNSGQTQTGSNYNVVADTDVYLCRLEIILKRIHTTFYMAYDQWIDEKHGTMPDLKQIIPDIRRQILSSVSLCFSHIIQQNYPMEKHCATIMAQAMGAKVTQDLQFDHHGIIQTTHIIAGKRTLKVYQAQQNNIKVVTPEWLSDCYEQWEKQPEENYILTRNYKVRKWKLFTEDTPRVSKRRHCDMQQSVCAPEQSLACQQPTTERKHSKKNENNLPNKIVPELLFDQYNFSVNDNESLDIENQVNDLRIEDVDDSNDSHPGPAKQQRTAPIVETVDKKTDDNDIEDFGLEGCGLDRDGAKQ